MAGIEIKGLEEILKQCQGFGNTAATEALEAAENAAAKLIKERLQAAAPVGSMATRDRHPGQLKRSIRIVKYKDRAQLHGLASATMDRGATQKLVIGPERKTGFYGFFLEHGWRSAGSKRIARKGTKTTHSQSGTTKHKWIAGGHQGWFSRVADTVEQSAIAAGEAAAMALLRRFL